MGITGLLPLLSEAQRKGHVKEFAGQTVGIDSYIWLYKGAFSCAVDIGLNQPTTKYITYFMSRALMLRHHGVEPLFIFDGGALPSKRATELERARRRTERRAQALKLWAQGKRKPAFDAFQKCLEATPWMAKQVIEELKRAGFRFLVAPYEADAQLAFLERAGVISAMISEDSDLVAFGCARVLFKMDQSGAAVLFDRARVGRTRAVDVRGWDCARLRRMCILSGCDYAASVPGIGLKRAHKYVQRADGLLEAVALMRADGVAVPDGYEEDVVRAELTFLFQRVYDPRTRCMAHVVPHTSEYPSVDDMPFIGELLEPRVAQQIAEADVDPFTYAPFGKDAPVDVGASSAESDAPAGSSAPKAAAVEPAGNKVGNTAKATARRSPRRAGTLVSLWKKSAFATITAKPAAVSAKAASLPAAAAAAAPAPITLGGGGRGDDEHSVRVKFRARDTHGETVATPERSRFFASQKRDRPATVEQLDASWSQSSLVVSEPSATQVASTEDYVGQDTTTTATTAGQGASQTQVESPEPVEDLEYVEARGPGVSSGNNSKRGVVMLFDQFRNKKTEVPNWVASPKYRKGN
ncbi:hypothetical protein IWW50_001917 [Coemansia erecta]|nr:hypothetical protein IWW50_001917 [Coemansia erecta]